MSKIIDYYDPVIWQHAGGPQTIDRSTFETQYQTGLLHLIYWMTYTKDGRQFMHDNIPSATLTEVEMRENLTAKFAGEFGVTGTRLDACIESHLAGVAWVKAYNAQDQAKMDIAEANFRQQVGAITWFMWEDGVGPLFPLPW